MGHEPRKEKTSDFELEGLVACQLSAEVSVFNVQDPRSIRISLKKKRHVFPEDGQRAIRAKGQAGSVEGNACCGPGELTPKNLPSPDMIISSW